MRASWILLVTVALLFSPKEARADPFTEALTAGDQSFRTRAYDQAAVSYKRAIDELAAQNRYQDLKFLARDVSDRFFSENTLYQPRARRITAHGSYVKLCKHAQAFFERYCQVIVHLDVDPAMKLDIIGGQLLAAIDFRGALALAAIAEHVPDSPLGPRARVRAARSWRTWAGIHEDSTTRREHAKAWLVSAASWGSRSSAFCEAQLELGELHRAAAREWSTVAKRIATLKAQPQTNTVLGQLKRLRDRFGDSDSIAYKLRESRAAAIECYTRGHSHQPESSAAPFCLIARAMLLHEAGDLAGAQSDLQKVLKDYPKRRREAEAALRQLSL